MFYNVPDAVPNETSIVWVVFIPCAKFSILQRRRRTRKRRRRRRRRGGEQRKRRCCWEQKR